MQNYLEFEKKIAELDGRAQELKLVDSDKHKKEIDNLEIKSKKLLKEIYSELTPWRKCQIARHPQRPHTIDYINELFKEFTPLHGDRKFSEDNAILGGFARLNDDVIMLIGHEKGNDTNSRLKRNFGMARPEGYRKAVRLMDLADRFKIPVITLIDTPGAYPGKGAEERGQAEAIARTTEKCLNINVPFISVIIGEGGSGGAVALATANKIIMLEHSVYSVISPEGCASILWKNTEKMREAAEALKLTAQDLFEINVIDEIISEEIGGAQRNFKNTIEAVGISLSKNLSEMKKYSASTLKNQRRKKFLQMGEIGVT